MDIRTAGVDESKFMKGVGQAKARCMEGGWGSNDGLLGLKDEYSTGYMGQVAWGVVNRDSEDG